MDKDGFTNLSTSYVRKKDDTGEGKRDNATSKNSVGVESEVYKDYMSILDLPTTLRGGTRAIRAKRNTYLPQEEGESKKKYQTRLERSILLGIFNRTIEKLAGEVFSRSPILSDDMPQDIKELFDDIDEDDRNLAQFTIDVFEQGICDGATHILVDYPAIQSFVKDDLLYYTDEKGDPHRLTKEVQKKNDWNPYWIHIKANQVIGFREEIINGKKRLTQVRIREFIEEPDGDFGTKKVEQIRVLYIGRFELYRLKKDKEGEEWAKVKEGETFSKDYIPLVTFMPGNKINRLMANPPLEGLAYLNLMHWQSSSDQRNILHYARLVMLFGKCITDDDTTDISSLFVGANKMIHSTEPDSDLKVVEHSGQAIGAGRQDLKDLETQMSLFGLTFLMPKQTSTATEKYLDYSENQSALKLWAEMFSDNISNALKYTANILDTEDYGSIKINTTFKSALQDQDSRVLLEGFIAGLIPRPVLITEYKRRGLIVEDLELSKIYEMFMEDKKKNAEFGIDFPKGRAGSPTGQAPIDNQPVKDTGN